MNDFDCPPGSVIGWTSVPLWAKFFFQLVFAGTAATIVSGAVAERINYQDRGFDPTKFKGGLLFGGGWDQLIGQFVGVLATAAYVLVAAFIAWAILKATVGIRVSREEEIDGLDHGEHGNEAYHGFDGQSRPLIF